MQIGRVRYIDMAAGVMIIWMIIYHAWGCTWLFGVRDFWGVTDASQLPTTLHAFINSDGHVEIINPCLYFPYLSFFMPWFFYKSGQFFEKRNRKELLAKDTRKLLLTFAIWSAIGYVFYLVFGALMQTLTLRGATYSVVRDLFLTGKAPINEPLWFLLTLFGVRLIANLVLPQKNEKYGWAKIVVIVVCGYLLAYLCFRWNHRLLPYWVANGASGLVFFALGYALRDVESKWWLIVPCALVYIICCFAGFPMVDMMYNKLLAGSYLLWMPVAFCGIVVFNASCRWISQYVRLKPIELVGQNAMIIYITHILIVRSCIFVVEYFKIEACYPYMFWIILVAYFALLPLLCYLVPRVPILIGKTK